MSEQVYTAIGLMSGTSLDGVDAAVIRTDGHKIIELGYRPKGVLYKTDTSFEPFSSRHKAEIAYAIQTAVNWKFEGPKPNILAHAEDIIDQYHMEAIHRHNDQYSFKSDEHEPVLDVIGYHGQTVLHVPPENGQSGQTLQIGNGQRLANEFNVPCVFDFRTDDVAAGGQGAPLAPIYHQALCDYSNLTGNILVLNLGGVGNFTWVGKGSLMASDTGPANGPLDSWLQKHGHDYDPDGAISATGQIDFARIDRWLAAPFFQKPVPKSADRYDFDVISELEGMPLEDGAATLAAFSVLSIKKTFKQLPAKPDQVIVCGGGRKNRTIMTLLEIELNCPVKTAEKVGWRGDFIEAEAFAYLAVRRLKNLPISYPGTTGVPDPMTGGKIVYPVGLD